MPTTSPRRRPTRFVRANGAALLDIPLRRPERAQLLPVLVPAMIAVALMLVWAVHDGGYNTDTWYWGALILLGATTAVAAGLGRQLRISRAGKHALLAFALYVGWSYLSIAWAQYPGAALEGSNRALLYFLVFALMLIVPWTPEGALFALLTFVLGVGVIAVVLLIRLASADHVSALVVEGRLAAPTGYSNSTAALFTIEALTATVLSTVRRFPAVLQGLLLAFACAGYQLALMVQSRGWLFTLPLIAIVALVIVPDRLRIAAASLLPIIGTLAILKPLLDVFRNASGNGLSAAAAHAGKDALVICAVLFVAGALIAHGEKLVSPRSLRRRARRVIGVTASSLAVLAIIIAGSAATHGHPVRYISRQWHGFSHEQTSNTGSHFTDVGSGRYDFWRVSLDAFASHPLGGLGQDNFADYYVRHRRTEEEPAWTHSLELRLLSQTGIVGLGLFAWFLVAAIIAAVRPRRGGPALVQALVGAALLPLVVWLIHGSIDWFWEMPALSGPALGFLGMCGAFRPRPINEPKQPALRDRLATVRRAPIVAGGLAFVAATLALGLPYLAVRETSIASDIAARNPSGAIRDLNRAADLNPLSSAPGTLGGTIALKSGQYAEANHLFEQAISRESGAWFPWLGAGLAASELGDRAEASHDFTVAASINRDQPAVTEALARVHAPKPLTPPEAFKLLAPRQ